MKKYSTDEVRPDAFIGPRLWLIQLLKLKLAQYLVSACSSSSSPGCSPHPCDGARGEEEDCWLLEHQESPLPVDPRACKVIMCNPVHILPAPTICQFQDAILIVFKLDFTTSQTFLKDIGTIFWYNSHFNTICFGFCPVYMQYLTEVKTSKKMVKTGLN